MLITTTTTTTTTTSNLATMFGRVATPPFQEVVTESINVGLRQRELLLVDGVENEVNIWALPTDCTALVHAFLASFSMIIVSELGDKTFIITAILAMKNSRLPVFIASASALLLMTILSVGMGVAVTVIPEIYTHYASIVLFLCFGLRMLKEAYDMNNEDDSSEFEEVQRSLEAEDNTAKDKHEEKLEADLNGNFQGETLKTVDAVPDAKSKESKKPELLEEFKRTLHFAPIFIKVFTMVFVAEWGDRSQISTVILAAREDVLGVFVGSFIGHAICTGLAVIGGRFVAEMISVRTMTLLGGIIFLFFAAFELISGP